MKVIVLGRSQNNDVIINDPYVSRTHAQMVFHDDGKVGILDLGSKTGTFVNGQKIQGEYFLNPNDVVKIGNSIVPWQSYRPQYEDSYEEDEPMEEMYEDEGVLDERSFFVKYKKIIAPLLALLILGGAGFLSYKKGWLDNWLKKEKSEVVKDEDVKKEEKEEKEKLEAVGGDDYYLLLPQGFEEVTGVDENVDIHYADTIHKIDVTVTSTPIKEVEKKFRRVKDDKLLARFKESDFKKFSKKRKISDKKKENETTINDMEAIKLTISTKENKKKVHANRVYIKGKDNFYTIYIYTSVSKQKQLKENKNKMKTIIRSFKEGTYEDESENDEDTNKDDEGGQKKKSKKKHKDDDE